MAQIWQVVEHWVSGEPHTPTRRDVWLMTAEDVFASGWAVNTRLGDRGKPVGHQHYETEELARAAMAAHMEAAKGMWGGADWKLVEHPPRPTRPEGQGRDGEGPAPG